MASTLQNTLRRMPRVAEGGQQDGTARVAKAVVVLGQKSSHRHDSLYVARCMYVLSRVAAQMVSTHVCARDMFFSAGAAIRGMASQAVFDFGH